MLQVRIVVRCFVRSVERARKVGLSTTEPWVLIMKCGKTAARSESIQRGPRVTNLREASLGLLRIGCVLGERDAGMENFIHFSQEIAS